MAHHAVDDGRRELAVGEDRAPPAELDVGGEYHAPPLAAVRYDPAQGPRPVHVEGHVAEPVQDQEPRLGHVGEQPVERPLPLGLAEPRHRPRGLPEPHGVARRGRGDPEGGGHVGLAAPRLAVEDQVLRVAHERRREHLVAAPAVAEAREAPIVSPDMKRALAAPRKAACAASRPGLVCGMAATSLEQPRRPVVDAQVDLLVALDAPVPRCGPGGREGDRGAVDASGRRERARHPLHGGAPPAPRALVAQHPEVGGEADGRLGVCFVNKI